MAELCDPVDEDITGAGDIDALFVGGGVAAVGDPVVDDTGVIAGAGDIDALFVGGGVAAVGDPVVDEDRKSVV